MKKTVKIDIKTETYAKIEKKAAESSYHDIKNFLSHLLEEIFSDTYKDNLSKNEETRIRERLKKLGYID